MKRRRRHHILTLWKEYMFRTRRLLGPRPESAGLVEMREAKTILLEKRDNIGDFVLATSFLKEAYRRWNDREVTLACTETVAPLARSIYPRWTIRTCAGLGAWSAPKALRAEVEAWPAVDLMINLRSIRHQTETIFSSWIPAAMKLAFGNQFKNEEELYIKVPETRVYSHVLKSAPGPQPGVCRELCNYRIMARALYPDIDAENLWPLIETGETERASTVASLAAREIYPDNSLLLVPFPSVDVRSYPREKLVDVAVTLARRHGLKIAILGGPQDRVAGDELCCALKMIKEVRNLAGELSLVELVEVIRRGKLVLGVETGPVHMAVACGVPTVVILGGGHHGLFGPWGNSKKSRWLTRELPCFGCDWECSQTVPRCIREIPAADLVQAAEELLKLSACCG